MDGKRIRAGCGAPAAGQPVVQAVPLSVNDVGAVLVVGNVPLNPIWVEPPGARARFQSRLAAVTVALPDACVHVADQPGSVTRWPAGKANASVQPLTAAVPVLAMVTVAVKPPPPPQFDDA